MTNDALRFNVYCTTIKQQQRIRYSKTVLYNDNNIVNTSITGLLPNTTYTCCVLAVTSYGESEPVGQNITTTSLNTTTSKLIITYNPEQYLSTSIVCMYYLHITDYTKGVY